MTVIPSQPSEVVPIERGGFTPARRTVAEIQAARARVMELMRDAMKPGIHYGKIPGTPKPTLYKPGSEMLLSMFNLGARPVLTEDLSRDDEIRYRVQIEVYDRGSGISLCVAAGECSSSERKYRWREPICKEEFEETAEDRRREIWTRDKQGGVFKKRQVRTDPADIGNTILKMGAKRGLIAATLLALACSDVFQQDLEDLPPEWAAHLAENDGEGDESEGTIGEEPPDPKPVQQPAQPPAHLHVTGVRLAKQGKNARGEWKLYGIKFSDGKEAFTYSESLKKTADDLAKSKAACDRDTEPDEQHDSLKLTLLRPAEAK